jgi:hypothetical protein
MKSGYKKAFLQSLLLFVAGAVLQILFGDVPSHLLAAPWGVVVAVCYLYVLIVAYSFSNRVSFFRFLYSPQNSIATLCSMMAMCIIFGLTPQDGSQDGLSGALGFRSMTSSYPFNLALLHFVTSMVLRAIDDVRHWRSRRKLTLLLHLSVCVALGAAMFSSGSKLRVKVIAPLNHTVHVGYSSYEEAHQLPFTIRLEEFSMESYPPKLALYDIAERRAGESHLQLGEIEATNIEGYEIVVERYLDSALPNAEGVYLTSAEQGAAPAVLISVTTPAGELLRGWVTSGGAQNQAVPLQLDMRYAVVMLPPQPKQYLSRVEIVNEAGESSSVDIEVNHPARVGDWYIYQSGYDVDMGKWSKYSIFECVRDGWYPLIHYSMWAILIAGALMFLQMGRGGKQTKS